MISFKKSCEETEEAWGREGQGCQLVPQVGYIGLALMVICLFTEGVLQAVNVFSCSLFSACVRVTPSSQARYIWDIFEGMGV